MQYNTSNTTPEWLAEEISQAQERERQEIEEQEALRLQEQERQRDEAIDRLAGDVQRATREELRAALNWRYETRATPDSDVYRYRAYILIDFAGVTLRIDQDRHGHCRISDPDQVYSGCDLGMIYPDSPYNQFERAILLALGGIREQMEQRAVRQRQANR